MPNYNSEQIRKLLNSDFGIKILNTAKLHGQEHIKYAGERYEVNRLIALANAIRNSSKVDS